MVYVLVELLVWVGYEISNFNVLFGFSDFEYVVLFIGIGVLDVDVVMFEMNDV